jgi:pyruvate,water dikinase
MATWARTWSVEGPREDTSGVVRSRYRSFRELLSLNNECLEMLASVREDLQYVAASDELLSDRISAVCGLTAGAVEALEGLTGRRHRDLVKAVRSQHGEIAGFLADLRTRPTAPLSLRLSEIDLSAASEVGGKAAYLGEIRNRLRLPVPEGFAVTTQGYRTFCGTPLWARIRDATRDADLGELDALQGISSHLVALVMEASLPEALRGAIEGRAHALGTDRLAVRSSAVGEGGETSFAGQFLSLLDVAPGDATGAYRRVVASRFGERALCYRLSSGLAEVESPMAVLFMPVVRARTSGVLYTSDPSRPRGGAMWIAAARGRAGGIGDAAAPADLFVVDRGRRHRLLEQTIVAKDSSLAVSPILSVEELELLADRGLTIERHFACPQDIEWAFDESGQLWILQSRPLAMAAPSASRDAAPVREAPLLSGGRTVYPGRASGSVHLVAGPEALGTTPDGAILALRRASPEIVEVFPRIAGLVAEWGNLTGHAAALLREFRIPSAFHLPGALERLADGDAVSLDATAARVYAGTLWPPRERGAHPTASRRDRPPDPVEERLLALRLLDPTSFTFRPASCRSVHDVLRFCHEKAIEAMFVANDDALERDAGSCRRLLTPAPLDLHVLDLGGGLSETARATAAVEPSQIRSRPFQALWRGVSHPDVTWTRRMPARLSDLASVMASSLAPQSGAMRALGERSYLLVADEYMNLNSRLSFHFTLIDACVSETPAHNYISFRFAGGGAGRTRRDLRARFVEACLLRHGFGVDRRNDLVNAWFRKAPARDTEANLDVLGRLMACSSQLDMYMNSDKAMQWYVQQFLRGNYAFEPEGDAAQGASRNDE